MKKSLAAWISATALGVAFAAGAPAPAGRVVEATVSAGSYRADYQVLVIDPDARRLTLKGRDGGTIKVVAGPDVKNLAQVKEGDKVQLQYAQTLMVALKKGPALRAKDDKSDPSPAATRKVHLVADITQLDPRTGAMKVLGADGRGLELKVSDPKALEGYKAGDHVEGTFVQLIAIVVLGPAAKK
jgi:Cu/Ag efflux protein CusF